MNDDGNDALSGDADFREAFGEELVNTLNLETWDTGLDLERAMGILQQEVSTAVNREGHVRALLRAEFLPRLKTRPGAPSDGGVYQAFPAELADLHEALLFPGRVEAVNGTSVSHDSLPLGITQIGVAVVSYGGTSGHFSQRFYRKEMSANNGSAIEQVKDFIDMRQNRSEAGRRDNLSKLARRGIKTYAERAILVDKAQAEWRIGHGHPCAYELLSGSGYASLLDASLHMLWRLIKVQKKFVFVNSTLEDRGFLTLGYALDAGEYAILDTLEPHGTRVINGWRYGDRNRDKALDFVQKCCPDVLMGLYRVSNRSPPRMFYAHREHVHIAARLAMADSILRPERGYPMLLDVADVSCRGAFGAEGFLGLVQDAYARAGASLQFFNDL